MPPSNKNYMTAYNGLWHNFCVATRNGGKRIAFTVVEGLEKELLDIYISCSIVIE